MYSMNELLLYVPVSLHCADLSHVRQPFCCCCFVFCCCVCVCVFCCSFFVWCVCVCVCVCVVFCLVVVFGGGGLSVCVFSDSLVLKKIKKIKKYQW